jgi:hypothetical protein
VTESRARKNIRSSRLRPCVSRATQTTRSRIGLRSHTLHLTSTIASQSLERKVDPHVRTMFVLYTLLIVGGIVVFITVGLTQQ